MPPVMLEPPVAPAPEDLRDAAEAALAQADALCAAEGGGDCAWYHASWPVLRALGVVNSPGSDDEFLRPALADAMVAGARRVLVCGCADAAMLARVFAAAPAGGAPEVTVLDRCGTPLMLCARLAARLGRPVRCERVDALAFEPAAPFDLVVTHSFLTFFTEDARRALVAAWWRWLAPGGAVLTAQRVRPGESEHLTRFPAHETERLAQAAALAAEGSGWITPARAGALARGYGERHETHLIGDERELSDLFTAQGFVLEHFAPPGGPAGLADRPGAPANPRAHRWRILARKPGRRP